MDSINPTFRCPLRFALLPGGPPPLLATHVLDFAILALVCPRRGPPLHSFCFVAVALPPPGAFPFCLAAC